MLIPKKDRLLILESLFQEGVMVAHKDFNAPKHHILDTKNLYVIKLMQSLKSRELVRESFSWMWYYYYLTNEGIEYLRDYLSIAEDVVPNTLKKKPAAPRSGGASRGGYSRGGDDRRRGYDDKKAGGAPGGSFEPSFRSEGGYGRGGERFGRGGGRGRGSRGGFGRGGARDE
eukprot:CAMPEP_0119130684 /NCGR_PEP_ID=MMETSP1310-20130426/8419_1 /TAXON_ID=464262 /ORGANISM="Genus nov. species nov., Strain RCC2339" /LENGTH=171 /DNA_ID=CAMNT_0007121211 /DNA_START=58 /DNA_END=573 /DNA_ORIENTATION=+